MCEHKEGFYVYENDQYVEVTLPVMEFIGRFVQHILKSISR